MYTDSNVYLALAYIQYVLPYLFPSEFYNGLICDAYFHYDSYSRPASARGTRATTTQMPHRGP